MALAKSRNAQLDTMATATATATATAAGELA
jgi:hypothetical protein